MAISSDRMFRVLLLMVGVGLWVAALPTFARGIIAPAFTRDLLSAGVAVRGRRVPHPERDPTCRHRRATWALMALIERRYPRASLGHRSCTSQGLGALTQLKLKP